MRKGLPNPVVRLTCERNRTPTGKRTATPARHAARYVAFGRGRNRGEEKRAQRGQWVGPGAAPHTHEAVLAWAETAARGHEYTFQALLSVPAARLTAADYAEALAAAGEISSWRMMAHDDTAYSHAHVLFFRDKRMNKETFRRWQRAAQRELAALEEKRLAGREAAQEIDGAEEEQARRAAGVAWEVG